MNKKMNFIEKGKIDKSVNHTEIACIIDRSGSMASIKDDAIGGFNTFLEEQKKLNGTASMTLVLFDDQYEMIYDNIDLEKVENLTDKTFQPRGYTALLDAIGKTINNLEERLSKQEFEFPPKVIICILTDGAENRSKEFNNEQIKELIENKRKQRWEFIFLAANQDAFSTAARYGISQNMTMNFAADAIGTRSAYTTMSTMVSQYRNEDSNGKEHLGMDTNESK